MYECMAILAAATAAGVVILHCISLRSFRHRMRDLLAEHRKARSDAEHAAREERRELVDRMLALQSIDAFRAVEEHEKTPQEREKRRRELNPDVTEEVLV